MVNVLDDNLLALTGALDARGLWENTLMVFTSDNGGCITLDESGGNNWPLKGGKYSDFEGGIRASAFVSGGYLPEAVRGTTSNAVMHIADWYTTFSLLAGVDPFDSKAAAQLDKPLPPVSGLDLWPVLSGQNATSPHADLPVGSNVFIDATNGMKLVLGTQRSSGWQGETYPNASSLSEDPEAAEWNVDCTSGW